MTSPNTEMEMSKFESLPADDPSKNGEDSSTSKSSQTSSEIEALRVHQLNDNLNIDPTALSLRHCQPQLLLLTPDADRTPSKECQPQQLSLTPDADRTPSKECSVETEGCVNADRTESREYCVETKGMLHDTREHVETYSMAGDNSFSVLKPVSEKHHELGHRNDRIAFLPSGRSALASEKQLAQISSSFADPENLNFQENSSLVGCEQIGSHSPPQRSLTSSQQQTKASCKINHHLLASGQEQLQDAHNASSVRIRRNQPLASGQQQFQETPNVSGIGIFGNQSTYPEPCSLLPRLPSTQTCTTSYNSVVPLHGGHSRFANPRFVMHGGHPRFTNPGFVMHGGHPRFAESGGNASIQLRAPCPFGNASIPLQSPSPFGSCLPLFGNASIQLRSPSLFGSGLPPFGNASGLPPFGNAPIQLRNPSPFGNASIQLRSLFPFGSGPQQINIKSFKEKENVKDTLGRDAQEVMTLDYSVDKKGKMVQDKPDQKNESSAETDTMDLDDFKENPEPENPGPLSKENPQPENPKSLGVNSSQSEKASFVKPELTLGSTSPVINFEFPALPPSENVDANSSRTQSLDMETLLTHAVQPSHLVQSAIPEPGSRWIKRLKLSASEPSTSGTKSSNEEEGPCHKKKSLGKSPIDNSEPTISKLHDKELIVFEETLPSSRYGESLSIDTAKKGKCFLMSQSWIRRWCRNPPEVPQKQSGQVVICEPQRLKLGSEDKRLPSIAALALMGRTMNESESCEYERRGSVVVWHTKKF